MAFDFWILQFLDRADAFHVPSLIISASSPAPMISLEEAHLSLVMRGSFPERRGWGCKCKDLQCNDSIFCMSFSLKPEPPWFLLGIVHLWAFVNTLNSLTHEASSVTFKHKITKHKHKNSSNLKSELCRPHTITFGDPCFKAISGVVISKKNCFSAVYSFKFNLNSIRLYIPKCSGPIVPICPSLCGFLVDVLSVFAS